MNECNGIGGARFGEWAGVQGKEKGRAPHQDKGPRGCGWRCSRVALKASATNESGNADRGRGDQLAVGSTGKKPVIGCCAIHVFSREVCCLVGVLGGGPAHPLEGFELGSGFRTTGADLVVLRTRKLLLSQYSNGKVHTQPWSTQPKRKEQSRGTPGAISRGCQCGASNSMGGTWHASWVWAVRDVQVPLNYNSVDH